MDRGLWVELMSHKSPKIAQIIANLDGKGLDAHYLGYFECFNRQLFFEAHEVLEELWLPLRGGPQDRFYRGLIQFAGAFVHVQKKRWQPAIALLRLARNNLELYPTPHERFDIAGALKTIDSCVLDLGTNGGSSVLSTGCAFPKLTLSASVS